MWIHVCNAFFYISIAYVNKYEGTVGEVIERTTDLSTTCGYALLAHKNEERLFEDFKRLIDLQDALYDFFWNDFIILLLMYYIVPVPCIRWSDITMQLINHSYVGSTLANID